MSWLNLNDSLSNLKGQITSFANNVLADDTNDAGIANGSLNELQQLCANQQEEINKLRKLNQEFAAERESLKTSNEGETTWSWNVPEVGSNDAAADATIPALKRKIVELEKENKELAGNLELLDSDFQENTEKLVSIKDRLQSDYSDLEDKYNELKAQRTDDRRELENLRSKLVTVRNEEKNVCDRCEELLGLNRNLQRDLENSAKEASVLASNNATLAKILEDTQSIVEELQNKSKLVGDENVILIKEVKVANETIRDFETKSAVDAENFKKLATILEGYEQKVSSLKAELEERKTSNDEEGKRREIGDLQKKLLEVSEDTHRRYVNILTENVKRYVDCVRPSDLLINNDGDVNVAEFSHHVENIMKILLDLQCKCESLEKEVYNIAQEKTDLLTEKNHEIEKLLQNSEILSQEVITKTQTIKDYENECGELIKNNDILINELEQYKSNSGLQTISESNEDNLLMLETQLDNANRRIDELEVLLAKRENALIEEVTTEMRELDLEGLEAENAKLKETVGKIEGEKRLLEEERDKLSVAFEKIKVDLENTEYQYTEVQVNLEALREELENQRRKFDELFGEKLLLEKQNFEFERNNEEVRTELNVVREKLLLEEDANKHLQIQIRSDTEKLQNAKMNETTMKLQYDTISKELATVTEAKVNLETNLKNTLADLGRCLESFSVLQNEHDELKQKLQENSQKIDKLEEEKVQFENLAVDETGDLLNNLHLSNDVKNKMETETSVFSPNLEEEMKSLREENSRLATIEQQHSQCSGLETKLQQLIESKNELTNVIITKHQENVTYHNEIQRLSQILTLEVEKSRHLELQLQQTSSIDVAELEKLRDQNGFLRQKCEIMAENLLKEQAQLQQVLAERSGTSEKEIVLNKKLERLQSHLIEIEDHYTQELLKAEERNAELQSKVNEIEQREKNSSTMYTSVSIRANQHVETLQHQLQLITGQRDELRKKISDAEDHAGKQAAALANLQFVLEQFQKDKEKDVHTETERIRRQISAEKRVQEELRKEISSLQSQLEESKQGLLAASRLSDQLEQSKQLVTTLKTEVSQLKEELSKSENKLKNISSQTDGKVDKSLIKNLIIGLVSTNNNLNKDQKQILKIIATVLDFNQQDHDKVELNKPQQGWLGSILAPQTSQGISQESLSQAFVKFLENESKPRVVPSLLNNNTETANSRKSSTATNPRQSPLVLAEVVLPTFADFAQNRNSSSILKDVLKDNS